MTSILRHYRIPSRLLNESEKQLVKEMGKLTESMQGLRDAIKRQENQLSNFIKHGGFQEINLEHNREINEDKQVFELSNEKLHSKMEPLLHSVDSEISQMSHWSCSLDTINSSIDDLKHVLKNQDKQVITLISENEELKNKLKRKEKELKKQKFLLKAERETFEQYKKDTLNGLKKDNCTDETEEIKPDKTTKELIKLKSELAHFKQMFVEQRHTMNRLSKKISIMKDDKIQLKDKLIQQEKRYSKFIMEMAQRFNVSRKEFNMILSKKFESVPISPTNLAVSKIADRNARLAYDNCMLKLELNELREKLFAKQAEEHTLQCLTTRSNFGCENNELSEHTTQKQNEEVKKGCALKTSMSEKSGLSVASNINLKCEVKSSVTSLIERNSEKISRWNRVFEKRECEETTVLYRDNCEASGSESMEVMRTESAPQLRLSNDQL